MNATNSTWSRQPLQCDICMCGWELRARFESDFSSAGTLKNATKWARCSPPTRSCQFPAYDKTTRYLQHLLGTSPGQLHFIFYFNAFYPWRGASCIKVFQRSLYSLCSNVKQSDVLHRKQLFTYVKHNFTPVCMCARKNWFHLSTYLRDKSSIRVP